MTLEFRKIFCHLHCVFDLVISYSENQRVSDALRWVEKEIIGMKPVRKNTFRVNASIKT